LNVLGEYASFLVVMHDNPDPDAIAAGWAISCLIERRLSGSVRLVGAGAIVRAENKHMVELLSPPVELVCEIAVDERTAAILVDCGLEKTNHLLTRASARPVAIIDHHVTGDEDRKLPFADIRTGVAASASIAASYLREQQIEPGMQLATAVLYAIRTETRGTATCHSPLDRSVVTWLTGLADATLLAEIETAPLGREYYGDLALAMQNTFVYGDAALCFLPRASCAEIVGEVADLLIRGEGIQRVLCAAVVAGDLMLSARTERDGDNAARLLQTTLDGLGGCGGHVHRAGGSIIGVGKKSEDLYVDLRTRWLAACGVDRRRGKRLVAKREIVENL
jgi:nanoRNase/pAp phosphatase (c-di-AMP/oligoRNAs hydrolase)